jgi:hypothetical protein
VNVNAADLGGDSVDLFRLRTAAGGPVAKAFVSASGNLGARSDVSGDPLIPGVDLGTGWHEVELCGTVGAAGAWDLYRDGVKVVNGWVADTGADPVGRVQVGDTAAKTWTVNVDDVRLDTTPGSPG